MKYFLAKTDPETYSLQNLKKDKETVWDGVHNYQAIGVIKSWAVGDRVLVYHSQDEKKIVGLMEVVSPAFKDPNDKRGISWAAKVRFLQEFAPEKQISLAEIKETGKFSHFHLVSHSRLSTMACPDDFIEWMKEKDIFKP